MAVASEEVLVLGEFHEGFYPIMWNRYRDEVTRDFNGHRVNQAPIEEWYVHGIPSMLPLTKEDVVRILRASN